MASSKKVKLDSDCEDDASVDEDVDDEEDQNGSISTDSTNVLSDTDDIPVNFQARCIVKEDYHGVRRLLQQLFPKAPINLSGLANHIINQSSFGSVLKLSLNEDASDGYNDEDDAATDGQPGEQPEGQGGQPEEQGGQPKGQRGQPEEQGGGGSKGIDTATESVKDLNNGNEKHDDNEEGDVEDEVLGVTTLVKLSPSTEQSDDGNGVSCDGGIVSYLSAQLKEHCVDEASRKCFESVLQGGGNAGSGIIIHERFLNIPMDIGPPMLESLMDEVQDHFEGKEPEYYLFITRSHMEGVVVESGRDRKRKRKGKLKEDEMKLVIEFEEVDCLHTENIASFSFPVSEECDTVQGGGWGYDDTPFTPYRTVFVLEKKTLCDGISKLLDVFRTSVS